MCGRGALVLGTLREKETFYATDIPRNNFEGPRNRPDQELLFARDGAGVIAQSLGELHLDGTAAADHRIVLHHAPDDHDRVVKRSLRFLEELLGASAQDERACLRSRALVEDVEPAAIVDTGVNWAFNGRGCAFGRALATARY